MVILIRIILLVLLYYLLKYLFLAIIRRIKKTEAKGPADPSTQMVKDPVCGMYMDSRLAVRLENSDGIHYFCSETCKSKFLNLSSGTGASAGASG